MKRMLAAVQTLRGIGWVLMVVAVIAILVHHGDRMMRAESAPQQTVALGMTLVEVVGAYVLMRGADELLRMFAKPLSGKQETK